MGSDDYAVTTCYLEHLTDDDLAFLCDPFGKGDVRGDHRSVVRARRGGIEGLLTQPDVFEALFVAERSPGPLVQLSPFLAFAVAVERAGHELRTASYISEWVGVGRRTPLFDVPQLQEFMSSPWRRFFLAELLASYTRVASGSVLVATRRGFRRQRFSELDPVRLAALLDVVPEAERPGILRRLGDLALFLTGVFPDYVARHGFGPIDQGRLLRSSRLTAGPQPGPRTPGPGTDGPRSGGPRSGGPRTDGPRTPGPRTDGPRTDVDAGGIGGGGTDGGGDAVALLAQLGRRWYQAAFRLLPGPVPANVAVISEMPERFNDARRVLGVIAERLLFPHRDQWFGIDPG
jgi:hypothetical protein